MKRVIQKLEGFSVPILLIIMWILLSDKVKPIILPSFKSTIITLIELIKNKEILLAWKTSMYRIGTATLISILISVPLSLAACSYKTIKNIITPFTNFIRYIPVTIFYPLLITWIGIDEKMKITFLFITTFFVFLPNALLTFESTNKELIEVALSNGANKWQLVRYVYFPLALPNLCQSLLIMISTGFTYMIISETTNARYGLGHLMLMGGARGRTDMVFAAVIVTIITGAIIDVVGRNIIHKCFSWYFDD